MLTSRKCLVTQQYSTKSKAGSDVNIAQQDGSQMNDKVATITTLPTSTPAKDAPAAAQVTRPVKAKDNKEPAVEPVTKPAIKS